MTAPANNRILMLLENQPYPQDHRVHREATALAAAGYRVSVICPSSAGQCCRESVDNVRVYRFKAPSPANSFLGYLWEYGYSTAASFVVSLLVFVRQGFDVVHAHNPPETFVFIAAFYKLFGKRFVFDHHDLSPEMYRARFSDGGSTIVYHALLLLERLTCLVADHVISTNESYKAVEIERDHVPADRITVVRNGVEVPRPLQPDPAVRQKAKTIIGFVGVMGFQDGVDYLLRALHHLLHDLGRNDFYCVLMGNGDAWVSLRALAKQLRLDDHVWFTGRLGGEELFRYLSSADICVDPDPANSYNNRSTMIKMMEYMAFEKPIVAFDLPEHRVTAQQAAVYVTPNDEHAFATALAQLMDDAPTRRVMGACGRHRIETTLAWRYSVSNLLDVYRKVLPNATLAHHTAISEANELCPQAVRCGRAN
ncbi:MAG: glycosyl transferase group 1 [Candidatus Acidoferrum typicum]|nr:glycosyl transferase group 1 [Candidatus Acidoferrum typicum]